MEDQLTGRCPVSVTGAIRTSTGITEPIPVQRPALSGMGESASGTGTTPVMGRVAVGTSAAAALIIGGVCSSQTPYPPAPPRSCQVQPIQGPFELLATGLHFSVILGLIFAGNSLTRPDPDYREVLNLFRRNDTSGFNEAAPALPLLSCSFPAYWLGFGGVLLFVWRRHEAASGIGELSASLALLGAAGLALWMMLVALGKRFRHDAGSGVQEHEAALSANMLSRPGTRGPMEPYRSHVGIEYRTIRATIPLVELSATSKVLHFRFRFGRHSFWGHGTSAGNRYSRCSQHADCGRVRRRLWGLLFGIRAFRVRLAE